MQSKFAVFSLLVVTVSLTASAQTNRATITGVVSDQSGAIIANATVRAVHLETNTAVSTTATETGNYTMPLLAIGHYRVSTEAAGFKVATRDGVSLEAGATVRLDFRMDLGAVTESVEVSGKAVALEADTTRMATNLTNKLVDDMPLVVSGSVRNILNLATIVPEFKVANNYRIGGGQGGTADLLMDGATEVSSSIGYTNGRVPLSSMPVDAIAEFTVLTTGTKAEYGRSMGMISYVSKSGSNQLHGNAYEFLRNDITDARGFFAQSTPILRQSDYGATFGGPVVLPKIYNGRNRTFFFLSYEGFRNRAGGQPAFLTIPLPAMYNGDFSGWIRNGKMAAIYDPSSTRLNPNGSGGYVRDPFPGNQIPLSSFSQVARNYIALRPASMVPNLPGPVNNYFTATGSQVNPLDKGTARFDHHLGAKDRLSFLFLRGKLSQDFNQQPPGLPRPFNGFVGLYYWSTSNRFSWDRTITPRVVNSFHASYQRESGDSATLNSQNPGDAWNSKLGIKNTPGPDQALPQLTFSTYSQWSGNNWGADRGRALNIADDLTFIVGRHTFKGGYFYSRDTWYGTGQHRPNGDFDFSYLATAIPADQSQNTGNAFASFLLGYPNRVGMETPRVNKQTWPYMGGYFQDDWKVNSRLTINAGLRYEYTFVVQGGAILGLKAWQDLDAGTVGGFSNFSPNTPNPAAGGIPGALVWSGSLPGHIGDAALFDGYKKAFGPRLGFAYQLGSATVLRVSGGRFFGPVKASGGSTHFEALILNTNWTSNDLNVVDFPTLLDKGLPAWQPPPYLDPSYSNNQTAGFWQRSDSGRPPDFSSWSLDLQRQMAGNVIVSAAYTGTKGSHLSSSILNLDQIDPKYIGIYGITLLRSNINSPAARAANIPIPYPGFNSTVQRALSPYPQYQDVATAGAANSVGERAGSSTYHALILKADKRYSSGITLLGSYVFSKMFSNADSTTVSDRNVMDQYNRGLEKALSGDDQTHMARVAFSYDLPAGKGKPLALAGIVNTLLGDWGLAGSCIYESGTPMTVSPGVSPIGTNNRVFVTSYDNWRAPVSSNGFDPNKDVWWNNSAFQQGLTSVSIR